MILEIAALVAIPPRGIGVGILGQVGIASHQVVAPGSDSGAGREHEKEDSEQA
jgi:hypothetical protein